MFEHLVDVRGVSLVSLLLLKLKFPLDGFGLYILNGYLWLLGRVTNASSAPRTTAASETLHTLRTSLAGPTTWVERVEFDLTAVLIVSDFS